MLARMAFLITTLALTVVPRARAQEPGRPSLAATLSALAPMSTVRIRTTSGVDLQGDLRGSPSGPWSVVHREGEAPIRLREVDTVWRRRSQAGRGAAFGGTAGAVAGGIFAVAVLALRHASDLHGPSRTLHGGLLLVGGGIAIGGVAGVGIGSLIGSSLPRWDRVYP